MSKYIPLYRKYRPKNLQEVVGQSHIKRALTNAIELNKISHAYLFTGPRGTGKTSTARILAKSLNCQTGPTLIPCEDCPSCIDIKNSNPIDVIEIDAASNRKVEDAQNILEKIQYVPVNGRYKIYIIDEVHMLTNHAFNALLKTLEEPPENVIFILATTEPHKVLETIISRCQRFDFRRITTEDIVEHLKYIAKEEKIKIDEEALLTIAKSASGGMRDSLALLDQVSVLDGAKEITSDDVNKLLGRISFDVLYNLVSKIIESNQQEAIEILDNIYNSGNEPAQILINLLGYLKNLLVVKSCEKSSLLLDLTQLNQPQIDELKKQCENIDAHQIVFLIEKTGNYIKEIKATTSQQLWLEIAIIDLANLAQNSSLLQLQDRILKLEQCGVATSAPSAPAFKPAEIKKLEPKSEPIKEQTVEKQVKKQEPSAQTVASNKIEEPKTEEVKVVVEQEEDVPTVPMSKPKTSEGGVGLLWNDFLKNISSPPTISLLTEHTKPIEISKEKIVIGSEKEFAVKMLSSDMKKKTLAQASKAMFGVDVPVVIKLADASEFANVEKKNLVEESAEATPAKKTTPTASRNNEVKDDSNISTDDEDTDFIEHELAKKKKKVEKVITSDQVSMVMTLFDGKYID